MAEPRPYVWQMVKQAVEELGPRTTNIAVRDWILQRWPDTNRNTIGCQIIVCTVNHASRTHYPENKKPRSCETQYDFLFRPERGVLEVYDPSRHGSWTIAEDDDGRLLVQLLAEAPEHDPEEQAGDAFAAEAHLRDYLAQHLEIVEPGLTLFVDDEGNDGVEYDTRAVGRLDILAQDEAGGFVVIELKLSRGVDSVVGQVLRYMGWVRHNLANDSTVRGVVIVQRASEKLRYAASEVNAVELMEYALSLSLRAVPLPGAE